MTKIDMGTDIYVLLEMELKRMQEKGIKTFTASDLAKRINCTTRSIGGYLRGRADVERMGKEHGMRVWRFKE